MKLEVWDSPNSAGVVIDAIRCMRLGLDRGLMGTLVAPAAYFKKSRPSSSRTTKRASASKRSSAAKTTRPSWAPKTCQEGQEGGPGQRRQASYRVRGQVTQEPLGSETVSGVGDPGAAAPEPQYARQ